MKRSLLLFFSLVLSLQALTLPHSIYKKTHITPQTDYKIYLLMQQASKLFKKGHYKESTPLFIKALTKASHLKSEKTIEQYDYLYAHYGILKALQSDEKYEKEYIKLAKNTIYFLDKATAKGIWEEGELGQFQMKMYKTIGNKLASLLYKESKRKDKKKLKQALWYIKKSEKYIRGSEDFYIKETKEKITNALAGNPPLESEKEQLKIVKYIKSPNFLKKVPQNQ